VQTLLQGKSISIRHSECVFVAFSMQYAMRIHPIISSSVVCPAGQGFSPHYLKKGTTFCRGGGGKKSIEH
jgi:hypothetical protein